jgi:hypothetical protein
VRAIQRGLHRQTHVFEHAEVGKQVGELERPAQPRTGAGRGAQIGEVLPIQAHPPCRGLELPGDQVEIGGLARAIGADDGGERARCKGAGDSVHRHVSAKADREVLGLQHGMGKSQRLPAFRLNSAIPNTDRRRRSK